MIKAIILDFASGMIAAKGQDYSELISEVIKNSNFKTEEEVVAFYKEELTALEAVSQGENFMTMDEMEDKIITSAIDNYNLKKDRKQIHTLLQNFWMYAPIHDDVKEFFAKCTLPVYILTNHSEDYIHVVTRRNNLHPFGILSAENVGVSKPSPAFYAKAFEMTSYKNEEVLYVSCDLETNVMEANDAGIHAVLLDRKRLHRDAKCDRIRSLVELLVNLNQ